MNYMQSKCLGIRQDIFRTVCINKAGHLASSLSSVEILAALYFGDVLKYNARNPYSEDRDRFILSKGHAALALYYVLAEAGYYDKKEVFTFCKEGTRFGGLATYGKIPGIETTSGSLGHGLSYAAGIAVMGQIEKSHYKVYVLLGDGELQEGEIWEAAMFISYRNLCNLVVIIDNNGIQATGYNKDIIESGSIKDKWKAFGFNVAEVDGHDAVALSEEMKKETNRPKVIIANTIKGKGLSFVEGKGDWHYKMPSGKEIETGFRELLMTEGDLPGYEE